ncbi:hypothetical protein D3C87_1765930 [compost metagenome]
MNERNARNQFIFFLSPFLFAAIAGLFLPRLGRDLFICFISVCLGAFLVISAKIRSKRNGEKLIRFGVGASQKNRFYYILGWALLLGGSATCIFIVIQ